MTSGERVKETVMTSGERVREWSNLSAQLGDFALEVEHVGGVVSVLDPLVKLVRDALPHHEKTGVSCREEKTKSSQSQIWALV